MNYRIKNHTGERFGRLIVLHLIGSNKNRAAVWECICDCGNMATSTSGQLTHKRRPVKSCGCLTIERTKEVHTQHGDCIDARNNGVSSEYQAWDNMIARCERLSCREYCHYGGRGIMVCSQWKQSFTNFLADMGRKPTSKHSLDRINNDGNYEPLNCRWATAKQQINNRRLKKIEDFSNEIIRQEFIKRGLSI